MCGIAGLIHRGKSSMPDEMYKVFNWYKRDEWEKFLGATTQWDLDTYLDCLP